MGDAPRLLGVEILKQGIDGADHAPRLATRPPRRNRCVQNPLHFPPRELPVHNVDKQTGQYNPCIQGSEPMLAIHTSPLCLPLKNHSIEHPVRLVFNHR